MDKDVAQQVRQMAFDHMKNGYGVSDGEDISQVIRDYTMSLAPEQRLSASWTLNELFHRRIRPPTGPGLGLGKTF